MNIKPRETPLMNAAQRQLDQADVYVAMLAALRAVNTAVTCNQSQGGDLGQRIDHANPLTMRAVRAAIAKADGVYAGSHNAERQSVKARR